MISAQHTQSLTDFRQRATEILDRINKTGDAEISTVNGEARAVLLSPASYDDLARQAALSRDVAVMRRAVQELNEGKGREAGSFFHDLRKQLLATKTTSSKGKGK
jgi:prevent-host-death family protein